MVAAIEACRGSQGRAGAAPAPAAEVPGGRRQSSDGGDPRSAPACALKTGEGRRWRRYSDIRDQIGRSGEREVPQQDVAHSQRCSLLFFDAVQRKSEQG
jgi:hypothetical protein